MKQLKPEQIAIVSGGYEKVEITMEDGFRVNIQDHAVAVKSTDVSGLGTDHLSIIIHTR